MRSPWPGDDPTRRRTRRAVGGILVFFALVAAGCGSSSPQPREQGAGCSPTECAITFSNLGTDMDFAISRLGLLNHDDAETLDVTIVFTVEKGSTEVSFTDADGAEITVQVAAGDPVTVNATIPGSSIVFDFSPDGSIENGEVTIVRAE